MHAYNAQDTAHTHLRVGSNETSNDISQAHFNEFIC